MPLWVPLGLPLSCCTADESSLKSGRHWSLCLYRVFQMLLNILHEFSQSFNPSFYFDDGVGDRDIERF